MRNIILCQRKNYSCIPIRPKGFGGKIVKVEYTICDCNSLGEDIPDK